MSPVVWIALFVATLFAADTAASAAGMQSTSRKGSARVGTNRKTRQRARGNLGVGHLGLAADEVLAMDASQTTSYMASLVKSSYYAGSNARCSPCSRVVFDSLTVAARAAYYAKLRKSSQGYACVARLDGTLAHFGYPETSLTIADHLTQTRGLPTYFDADRREMEGGNICDVQTSLDYVVKYESLVQLLGRAGAISAALALRLHYYGMMHNKNTVFRTDGRPQLADESTVCIDKMYTMMYTAYAVNALEYHAKRHGLNRLLRALNIEDEARQYMRGAATMKNQTQMVARFLQDVESAHTRPARTERVRAAAFGVSRQYDLRAAVARWDSSCHPICKAMLYSQKTVDALMLKTCCASCTGPKCTTLPPFRSMSASHGRIYVADKWEPYAAKTLELQFFSI
jgi:hypothetical protein